MRVFPAAPSTFALRLIAVLLVAAGVRAQTLPAVVFPDATAVGLDAAPQPVSLTITTAGTLGSIQVLSSGSQHLDFNQTAGATCTAGQTYLPGQTCTVLVGFHPYAPGERRGAVVLLDAAGHPLALRLLSAAATGSLAVFVPGQINTIAGDSAWIFAGDGGPALGAPIFLPFGLAVDAAGDLFLADSSNNRIRRVDAKTQAISTVAGNGVIGGSGDGGPALSATLSNPTAVALDPAGNLFIADSGNNVIRRVDAFTGLIATVAGTMGQHGYTGDTGPATAATLNTPNGLAFDSDGNLFFADTGNSVIRELLAATGNILTVAGTGAAGFNGDNQPALNAQLNSPWSVTPAANGAFYIADQLNNRIRLVSPAGVISTVAGTGPAGFNGDFSPAVKSQLNEPGGVVLDPAGNLYVADSGNNRVRKISSATGIISTVAGNQAESFSGDGGPADAASLYGPYTLALDTQGSLLIADVFHNRIRKVQADTAILNYPAMRVGRVSPAQLQTLENDGNAALNLASIAPVTNAQVDATTTTCLAGTPLAPDATCTLGADFAPTVTGNPVLGSVAVASDAGNSPATLSLSGQVLDTDPTTVTLTSSENPATTGDTITFNVSVKSSGSTPTGAVSVFDGQTLLAVVTLGGGSGTFSTNTLARGQHPLTAAYPGDSSNAASTSAALLQTVADALSTTATTLSSSASPVSAGATLRLTANVAIVTQGTTVGGLTGTVSFMEGANTLGAAILTNGQASITLTTLTPGTHAVVATYSGNTTSQPSTSTALSEVVVLATTRLSLAPSANPGWSGAPLNLTATILSTGGVPTGKITFSDGNASLGTATLNGQGIATLSTPGNLWPPGTHTLTAAYAGDADDSSSTSALIAETINLSTTTTQLASSVNPAAFGAQISVNATVSSVGGTPTGTVQFFDGSAALGSAPLNASGVASLSPAALAIGSHNITAVYSGDTLDATNTAAPLTEVIQPTNIAAALSSGADPSVFAQPLALTATITGSGAKPTGAVAFTDISGASPISLGSAPLSSAGIATIHVGNLTIGSHQLLATYSGDTYHASVASAALTQHIVQATTTTLSPGAAQSTGGLPITFTAVVNGASGQPITGIVTITDGSATLVSLVPDSTGAATWTTSSLPVGAHTLTANYSGDTLNAPSASAPSLRTIAIASTQTTLTTSGSPTFSGTPLTLTATVTGNGGAPGGSITFFDGKQSLGLVPVTAASTQAVATLTTSTLTPGIHALTATYTGDNFDSPSTSPAVSEQIAERTTIAIASSANPSLLTDSVTFTITVSNGIPTAIPTGQVTLTDSGAPVGSATLDPAGHATFTLIAPALGTHTLVASYPGDSQNIPVTSQPFTQTVTLRPTAASFTPSAVFLTAGQQLILVSIVAPASTQARGPQPPTGAVTFMAGSTVMGTATVDATGVASLTLTAQQGTFSVQALYSGDSLYAPATSTAVAIAVGPPLEFLLTATPQTMTLKSGQHGALSLNVTTNAQFADTVALGCAGLPAAATCTFSSDALTLAGGASAAVTVTIDTGNPLGAGAQASRTNPAHRSNAKLPGAGLAACSLLAFFFANRGRRLIRHRLAMTTLLILATLSGLTALTGCGSNLTQTTTPAGAYTVQITATGQKTGAVQTLPIQLTVTP